MGFVKKIESNDKMKKRILLCREADMRVDRDFLEGTATVHYGNDLVLKAVRLDNEHWQMEYNDEFWDEIPRSE